MDNLEIDYEDEESEDVVSPGPADVNTESTTNDAELSDDSTDETASDSDAWSDSSDDDDHALTRTASGRPLAKIVEAKSEIKQAIVESGDDYFSHSQHSSTAVADSEKDASAAVDDDDGLGVDLKSAASTVVELLAGFGYEDLPSPEAKRAVVET